MLNKQKIFLRKDYFSWQDLIIGKYFHLFSITHQNNKISDGNCLNKPTFNNLNRLNHSSKMNNNITIKIKHFFQLFALGPQIL